MNTEERFAALEANQKRIEERQDRQDREHASLIEKAVVPIAELTETFDLNRQATDQRLTEILGSTATIDTTSPAFMTVLEKLLEYVDRRDKVIMDGVSTMLAKMNDAMAGKVGE